MSMNPNDPFNNPNDPLPQSQIAAPKKGRSGCLIGCGIVSGLVLLVCCGGIYWAMTFVSGEMAKEVERRLIDNEVVAENIGQLESVSLELMETSRQTQQAQEEGKRGVLVFSLEGSQGDAQLHIEQDAANQPDFTSATLVMPDGERIPIDASAPSDIDIDLDALEMELDEMIDSGDVEIEFEAPSFDAPEVTEEP